MKEIYEKITTVLLGLSVILAGCASSNVETVTETNSETVSESAAKLSADSATEETSAEFIWPEVNGELTADIGAYERHTGIDNSNSLGTDILASASGTVTEAGFDKLGDGYYVVIDHQNGKQTRYAHMTEDLQVAASDEVNQRDVIGYEGDTGNGMGVHLHFEISADG
ncbi:M23 family metallopeptidase [Mollicutes bacterium LVI A0075]|nr:M23 family metallopeptidase [Mollicutes bacterium LVI A0075]